MKINKLFFALLRLESLIHGKTRNLFKYYITSIKYRLV